MSEVIIREKYELRDVDAMDIIGWLNEHLGVYAREVIELRRENEALRSRYSRLKGLFDTNTAVAR